MEIVRPKNSVKQSTSWEADWSSARQEIPGILQKLQVHHRTHNCPPPVPILSSINPIYTSSFYSWLSILILSSHLISSLANYYFLRVAPTKFCMWHPFTQTCYTDCPLYSYVFGNSNNILWTVHSIKLPVSYCSPLRCHLIRQGISHYNNLSRRFCC